MREDKVDTGASGEDWAFLVRRWRTIVLVASIGAGLGLLISFWVRPVFEASSTLAFSETPASGPLTAEKTAPDTARLYASVQKQKALLGSPEFAARAATHLAPAAVADLQQGSVLPFWQRIGRWIPGTRDTGAGRSLEVELARRVTVRGETRSAFLEIRYAAFSRDVAAEMVNRLVDAYLVEAAAVREREVTTLRDAIAAQVAEAERSLGEQLAGLQSLEREMGLDGLRMRRAALVKKGEALEKSLDLPPSVAASPSPRGTPAAPTAAAARVAELEARESALLLTLGERHPDVLALRAQLATARAALPRPEPVAEASPRKASTAALQDRYEAVQREIADLDRQMLRYTIEQQKLEARRSSIRSLLEQQAVASPRVLDIQVVDRGRPGTAPISPGPLQLLGVGLAAGALVGLASAWVRDQLRRRVEAPEDIKDALPLPFLGIVPLVQDLSDGSLLRSLAAQASGLADSLSVVRTNIVLGSPEPPKVLVLAGPGAGVGKSTLATGLALGFAQSGGRVLLIDADLRRPSIHTILRLPQSPGLAESLASGQAIPLNIQNPFRKGLEVVTSGAPVRDAAERLGSPAMRKIIENARGRYDWVVINSPPVPGLPDALILGRLADGIVLVCSAGSTTLRSLRNTVDVLGQVGAPIVGFVLNRAGRRQSDYYGSSDYAPKPYTGPERRKAPRGPRPSEFPWELPRNGEGDRKRSV